MEFVEAQTAAGRVRGFWRDGSAAFLGIPFAEPPVGELRFAAPVPHATWHGVRDALEYGATPQRGDDGGITLIPEPSFPGDSTLNLNVFTPSLDGSLPVLVYIHGGGFTSGSPSSDWYDGASFNRDGVIVVALSYRLGFDGFGFIDGAPHNRGVRDWLLGLEWVHENIASFGGDPARVTIAGQSAGGGAVLTLLGMPAAQHLFAQAYSISGALGDVPISRAREIAAKIAASAGVSPSREGFASLSEEQLLDAQKEATDFGTPGGNPMVALRGMLGEGLSLGPMVDGELIARPTLESIRSGVGSDKPLILGAADDEFSMAFTPAKNKLRFIPSSYLLGQLGLSGAKRRAYRSANPGVRGTAWVLGRYLTDSMFRVPTLRVTEARGSAPTWLYRFAWVSPVHGYAVHCLDMPFIFDCLDRGRVAAIAGDSPPQSLADEVHGDAVTFVSSGAPGWNAYGDSGETHVFDVPSSDEQHGYESVRALVS